MAVFTNPGASVECSAACIQVRKITKRPVPLNIQKIDGTILRGYKYKTNIRNIIIITKELVPKKALISEDSSLNYYDTLEAETVEIFTENKVELIPVSNFSHVHGIQGNEIGIFTYAKIIAPFRFILERLAQIK